MQQIISLNEMYTGFMQGKVERKELESFIFENILQNFSRFSLRYWQADDSADFVSWIYPRIRNAIDTYIDTGSSFETYIRVVLQWAAREYRSRTAESRNAEYAAWTVRMPELFAHETEPEYPADDETESDGFGAEEPSSPQTRVKISKNPRQVLILTLKCYNYLSDDFIQRIAPRVGITKEELQGLVDKLRQLRLKHDDELRSMQERTYCQYYRCIIYEKRLICMPENSCMALRMRYRIKKARKRLDTMRKRLEKMRPDATNRQIAEVLGIAKGTVDSALHSLKNRWNNDPKSIILK